MAITTIKIKAKIHAEILGGDRNTIPYAPVVLDPLTKSYSGTGTLTYYEFSVHDIVGLEDISILHNGKNSRFTAGGSGSCRVELYIEDDKGASATHSITITVL